jgi:DNA-binding PadR family transcriptional regulator
MKAYCAGSGPQIGTGNFYRELGRLLADGSIETAERSASVDPRRAPYRITARGAARFDEWFAAPLGKSQGERVDDLALRLVVLPKTDWDMVRQTLELWKNDLWLRVKLLEQSRDREASRGGGIDRVRSLVFGRRLGHLAVDIELLDALLREFGAEASVPAGAEPSQASVDRAPQRPGSVPTPRATTSRRS